MVRSLASRAEMSERDWLKEPDLADFSLGCLVECKGRERNYCEVNGVGSISFFSLRGYLLAANFVESSQLLRVRLLAQSTLNLVTFHVGVGDEFANLDDGVSAVFEGADCHSVEPAYSFSASSSTGTCSLTFSDFEIDDLHGVVPVHSF